MKEIIHTFSDFLETFLSFCEGSYLLIQKFPSTIGAISEYNALSLLFQIKKNQIILGCFQFRLCLNFSNV